MNTVIYLANQQIQVITGSFSGNKYNLEQCLVADAPDGSIINGIIMDTEAFVSFIREFWASNNLTTKAVTLVVNSSKFVNKTIDMPNMSPTKAIEFVEREFSDIKRDDNSIYGYTKISSTKNEMKVYGESVPSEMITDYKELFDEAGISLSGIYSGDSSIIDFVNINAKNIGKTFVFQIADRMTLTTILWVDGSFYYLNSIRSFYDQGTEDYASDVTRAISQIIQFMQAHQLEYDIEMVLLAGLDPRDHQMYINAFSQQGINKRVVMFDPYMFNISGKGSPAAYMCVRAMSGLVKRDKRQNYLNVLAINRKKEKSENGLLKDMIGVIVVFAIMLILLITSISLKVSKKRELNKLTDYNEDVMVQMDVADSDALRNRNKYLTSQKNKIVELGEDIDTYPVCTSKVIDVIKVCAGNKTEIEFISFDATKGNVVFSASCISADDINVFIKELTEKEEFYKVDYTGYSYNRSKDMYDVHVTCTLAEAVGVK